MLIKTLPVGMLATNCYILTDEETKMCAVIDPGGDSATILDYIESNKLTAAAVFLTHGHWDHHMGLEGVLDEVDVPCYVQEDEVNQYGHGDRHLLDDNGKLSFYSEGDAISIGNLVVSVLETPGHSPGSVTLMCGEALFTGDTLFCGDCGRTDLEGSSEAAMMRSLKRLYDLVGDYEVYPGHEESSTLSNERSFNIYMRRAAGIN